MTTTPAQQPQTPDAGMWSDSTLRPYLRHTYDQCRKYTSISSKDSGVRDLNLHYFSAEVMMNEATSSRGALLALKTHQHMVFTTKYAGTSLLCKYIAMELSAGKVDSHMGALHEFLPVYIDLAGVDEAMYCHGTVLDQVITELNDHLVEWGRSSFRARLSSGGAVVIFDNLDHLGAAQQDVAIAWIKEAIDSGNKIVVSTRNTSIPVLSGIPVYEVAGLNLSRMLLMASHWIHGPERAAVFHMLLKKSAHLKEVVAHPVPMAMAIEVYNETSRLPEGESHLAREFLSLAAWTVKRSVPAKMGVPDYLQQSWLALVGFNLQKRSASGAPATASEAELSGWMQDVLGDDSRDIVMQNITGFLTKTSVFIRTRHGYGFAHKSLMIMTAAQHIERHVVTPSFVLSPKARTGISKRIIAEWAIDPAWKDVLDGVKAILQKERAQEWLDEFLAVVGGAEAASHNSGQEMSS